MAGNAQCPQVRSSRCMQKFKSMERGPARCFISAHPTGYNLFNLQRHSVPIDNYLYFRRVSLHPEKYNGSVKLI